MLDLPPDPLYALSSFNPIRCRRLRLEELVYYDIGSTVVKLFILLLTDCLRDAQKGPDKSVKVLAVDSLQFQFSFPFKLLNISVQFRLNLEF